jgi:hypothetical protein
LIRLRDIEQYCLHILKHQQSALVRVGLEDWTGCTEEITELVRLVNRNPGIKLTSHTLYVVISYRLSDNIRQGQFLGNIVEQTDKVMITQKFAKPGTGHGVMQTQRRTDGQKKQYGYLWLQMKPEYAEPWMVKSLGEWYTREQMPMLWEWQLRLGLQFKTRGVRPYCPQPVSDSRWSARSLLMQGMKVAGYIFGRR